MDYKEKDKKQLATDFVKSKYSIGRFLATCDAEMRKVDVAVFIEWVKDLAISRGEDAEYWQNQANNQAVIIERLDAEKEALNLKVCKLAEDNAKLVSDGIKVTNKLADMSEENRQLKNTISCYEDTKMVVIENINTKTIIKQIKSENEKIKDDMARLANQSYILEEQNQKLKQSLLNRFEEYKKLEEDYKMMHERYKTTYSDLHEEQIQNQSLMAEIEELKSISGFRNDLRFIESCEKIIETAKDLQELMNVKEGGK